MSENPRILFVGDHPYCYSGNGNMMRALLSTVDYNKFSAVCMGIQQPNTDQYVNSLRAMASTNLPYSLISAESTDKDPYCGNRLLATLSAFKFEAVVFVGLDVWCYVNEFKRLDELRAKTGINYVGLFPYDSHTLRADWVDWLRFFDLPCVYSEYGFSKVGPELSKVRYFRPPLADVDLYKPLTPEQRVKTRKMILGTEEDLDVFLFGFFGRNQFRKDIPKALKALSIVRKEDSRALLFCNTNTQGVFNIGSLIEDYGLRRGDVLVNEQSLDEKQMVNLYGSVDCLVNCSLQEGLSWTLLNAMLVGTPVIATDTTAQTELVEDIGWLVPCNTTAYLPTYTKFGPANVETLACRAEDLAEGMLQVIFNPGLRETMSENSLRKAQDWLSGVDDINVLLEEATAKKRKIGLQATNKIPAILFMQHSSAGDVLMTTQCFKGMRERHPHLPLVYMTQDQYKSIIEGNKYVDEVVSWDVNKAKQYEIVYNPHGERILPGGFNNLDATLYSMYPYFTRVEADLIQIQTKPIPNVGLYESKKTCVVHTTGGQAEYRTYKHLDIALKGLGLFVIQVGGLEDWPVRCADLDLRGELDWQQTAWIMSQAHIAVCVDSFPMHLAGAMGTNVVAIFGPAPARVTQPRMQHGAKSILLEPNKLDVCPSLTSCWGQSGQMKCQSPCINTISPHRVKAAIKKLLGGEVC